MSTFQCATLAVGLGALAVVPACTDTSPSDEIEASRIDAPDAPVHASSNAQQCRSFSADDFLVDPFGQPLRIIFNFGSLHQSANGYTDGELAECVMELAQVLGNSVEETSGEPTLEVAFYSLTTNDEYEADDVSALHFQYVVTLEPHDEFGWEASSIDENLDRELWGRIVE